MKMIKFTISALIICFFKLDTSVAASSIQSKIDTASKWSTIKIDEGEYEESLIISKPLTLDGGGKVTLRSCESGPVVSINDVGVTLKNIKVEHCGDNSKDTAIYVTGSKHIIKGLEIETKRFGIKLENASEVEVRDSEIIGSNKGNGIDLWKSDHNKIENLHINKASDGIYLEQSNENTLYRNSIENSRYGMHLMFSNDNFIEDNISKENITGTMLMESTRTVVRNNKFSSNSTSVNAQGLLLYIASDTKVSKNEFYSNRVGIYIEKAENNEFNSNKIVNNFIGVQLKNAISNKALKNTFVGNVNDAQAIESSNNQFKGNYWDSSSKVDTDGNGDSELPFAADPFFLTLTTDVPEYQIFFQSPGMNLLQSMLKSPTDQLLIDEAPLMVVTEGVQKEKSSNFSLWIISFIMIIVSINLYIFGRKRN